jgi:hypothetical protein
MKPIQGDMPMYFKMASQSDRGKCSEMFNQIPFNRKETACTILSSTYSVATVILVLKSFGVNDLVFVFSPFHIALTMNRKNKD